LIIDQILDAIKKGELKPGDALPSENELVRAFDVGRTSVREALAGLEYMNIIVPENGKVVINRDCAVVFSAKSFSTITKSTKKQHDDLLEVRRVLETEFAQLAAQRATVNDIKRLRQILRAMGAIVSTLQDTPFELSEEQMKEFVDLDVKFHLSLARSTQNSMYIRIYERLKDMMFVTEDNILDAEYMTASYEIFGKIVKSIEERDYHKSVNLMKEHIERTKNQYQSLED
jgi:DNA-binding FadR family transcriptional regulator